MYIHNHTPETYEFIKKLDPDKNETQLETCKVLLKEIENKRHIICNKTEQLTPGELMQLARFLHITELKRIGLTDKYGIANEKYKTIIYNKH